MDGSCHGDAGHQVEPGTGEFRGRAGKLRKAVAIANEMKRRGTESAPGTYTGRRRPRTLRRFGRDALDEAKPDEASNRREESLGDEAVEPEIQERGAAPRRREAGDQSGDTLEQTARAERVPDRVERKKTDAFTASQLLLSVRSIGLPIFDGVDWAGYWPEIN